MKPFFSLTLLAVFSVVGVACLAEARSSNGTSEVSIPRSEESRAYLHSFNVPSHGVALEGYCPVAYFAVNKPVRGKPEHASTHNGITYYFVSADAKGAFDAEPEKYVPAYGGWCAFGMSVQDKFPVDPRNFKIEDGKLLVFLKNKQVDARELWSKGKKRDLVKKADAHWKKVQG